MNKDNKIFIFIGPPGAGKGSLSKLCVQRLGWDQLSTGNLCRKHIAEQTIIGKEIDLIIKFGKLISDDLITQMVGQWLNESMELTKGIILDGYPRTLNQARLFDGMIENVFHDINLNIIELYIPDDIVIKRLCARYVCENKSCQTVYSALSGSPLAPKRPFICDECSGALAKRVDDSDETVSKRIKVYRDHENDLLDYYRSVGQPVLKLNANKDLDMVFDDFIKMVG